MLLYARPDALKEPMRRLWLGPRVGLRVERH